MLVHAAPVGGLCSLTGHTHWGSVLRGHTQERNCALGKVTGTWSLLEIRVPVRQGEHRKRKDVRG